MAEEGASTVSPDDGKACSVLGLLCCLSPQTQVRLNQAPEAHFVTSKLSLTVLHSKNNSLIGRTRSIQCDRGYEKWYAFDVGFVKATVLVTFQRRELVTRHWLRQAGKPETLTLPSPFIVSIQRQLLQCDANSSRNNMRRHLWRSKAHVFPLVC